MITLLFAAHAQSWPLVKTAAPPQSKRIQHMVQTPHGTLALWPYGSVPRQHLRWLDGRHEGYWQPEGTPPGEFTHADGAPPLQLHDLHASGGRIFAADRSGWFELHDTTLTPLLPTSESHRIRTAPVVWGESLLVATDTGVAKVAAEGLTPLVKLEIPWPQSEVWALKGDAWIRQPVSMGGEPLLAGSPTDGMWIAGRHRVVRSLDEGSTLQHWDLDLAGPITALQVNGPDDTWVGTDLGMFAHWNGAQWTIERTSTPSSALVSQGPLFGSGGAALGVDQRAARAMHIDSGAGNLIAGNGVFRVDPSGITEVLPPEDGLWPGRTAVDQAVQAWTPGRGAGDVLSVGPERNDRLIPWSDGFATTGYCGQRSTCVWRIDGQGRGHALVKFPTYAADTNLAVDGDHLYFRGESRSLYRLDGRTPDAAPVMIEREGSRGPLSVAHEGSLLVGMNEIRTKSGALKERQSAGRGKWPQAWHGDRILTWTLDGVLLETLSGKVEQEWIAGTVDDALGPLAVGHLPNHATVIDLRTGKRTEHPCLPDGHASLGADGAVLQLVSADDGAWLYRSAGGKVQRASVPDIPEACGVGERGAGTRCGSSSRVCTGGCQTQLIDRGTEVWIALRKGSSILRVTPEYKPVDCPRP